MTTEVPPELLTTIPGRPAVPDVLLEHLEELAHLTIQWRAMLFSPEVPLRRLSVHAKRIEAHVDGLRVGAPASVGIARALLEEADPWLVFAGARAWLELETRTPADVVAMTGELPPEKRAGWKQAFRVLPPQIARQVFPDMATLPEPALEVAMDALSWHGLAGPAALAKLSARPEAILRFVAARHGADHPLLQRLAADENADVRAAAMWSEALLHPHSAVERALSALASSKPDPIQVRIIGLFGKRSHTAALRQLLSEPPCVAPALYAMRDLGAPEAAEALLPLLDNDHPQADLAGEVFASLTGWVAPDEALGDPETAAARARHLRTCDRNGTRLHGKAVPWNEEPSDEPMLWLWRKALQIHEPALSWLRKEVPPGLWEGTDSTEILPGI